MSVENFVNENFSSQLEEVRRWGIGRNTPELDEYEKTLIYVYTSDGFETLNETLRDGGEDEYEDFLNDALDKLPNVQQLVYRGVDLEEEDIQIYRDALENDQSIEEPSFTSTTASRLLGFPYNACNVFFRIMSQTGKFIADLSYYGPNRNPDQNEYEVLFKSKTQFTVIEVTTEGLRTIITLEEL